MPTRLDRRAFLAASAAASLAFQSAASAAAATAKKPFQFRYSLASCMYGYTSLDEILPEVHRCGATGIDLWPKVHGNQREQLDQIGESRFAEMLRQFDVKLSCITQYKLGPFGIDDEIKLANRLGCHTIVVGGQGPKNLAGAELKTAVAAFIEKLQPTLELARENKVRIAIENHANNLIHDADSLRVLAELAPADVIGVAFAPYHLPQDPEILCNLLRDLGDSVDVFYAWQHGMGCSEKLPKQQELLQLPGRGTLDFAPLVKTLAEIEFDGWTEIFMHPVPRGIPILETTSQVSQEINRSRRYLDDLAGESLLDRVDR
ncbi:sugar phosphate isomerase/epimerase [Stieleria sp. TO1_6]|uniref:sugar phosphate isomerase/epimerase family protein n=1 Tax=Stieleria tagensis TaxID=2956795 RepID=UPI00209AD5EF|nr:TIM barrel protein [Stieleria tagensis]MCO8121975.1 sugar phosphate isomerase/epimerase [Stieleria tagensis]